MTVKRQQIILPWQQRDSAASLRAMTARRLAVGRRLSGGEQGAKKRSYNGSLMGTGACKSFQASPLPLPVASPPDKSQAPPAARAFLARQ